MSGRGFWWRLSAWVVGLVAIWADIHTGLGGRWLLVSVAFATGANFVFWLVEL